MSDYRTAFRTVEQIVPPQQRGDGFLGGTPNRGRIDSPDRSPPYWTPEQLQIMYKYLVDKDFRIVGKKRTLSNPRNGMGGVYTPFPMEERLQESKMVVYGVPKVLNTATARSRRRRSRTLLLHGPPPGRVNLFHLPRIPRQRTQTPELVFPVGPRMPDVLQRRRTTRPAPPARHRPLRKIQRKRIQPLLQGRINPKNVGAGPRACPANQPPHAPQYPPPSKKRTKKRLNTRNKKTFFHPFLTTSKKPHNPHK